MISPECFGRQLVFKKASEMGCRNPVMLEKSIIALQLLGHLAESGLPIQFKGGTSLLLRLNPIRRLSIDVDTIGILYDPLRKTDIVKQLFDVGALFDAATDLSVAAEAYSAAHARQLVYRKTTFSLADTLKDSMHAGFLLSQLQLKGGAESEDGKFLYEGVHNLANHLVNFPFRHAEARVAAGKVACAAAWIQRRPAGVTIEKGRFQPDRIAELRDVHIQAPWTPLTRLMGGNAEAFHYWYQAQRILTS